MAALVAMLCWRPMPPVMTMGPSTIPRLILTMTWLLSSSGPFSRAELLCHLPVRENNVRVALQCLEVMFGKSLAGFGRDEQKPGLIHQGVDVYSRQRLFLVQRHIHRDDELGQWVQPGEPRVVSEEVEKMIRRWDRADRFLVTDALGINQRFVQSEQRVAELLEPLLDRGCHVRDKCAPLRTRPQTGESGEIVNCDWLLVIGDSSAQHKIGRASC